MPRPTPPPAPSPGQVTAIDLTALFPLQQAGGVLIYDVRPGFVLSFGRIPGAVSWPRREFDRHLAAREPEIRTAARAGKAVVLYCTDAACPDARAMADLLATRGHDVSVLSGGYAGWKEAGLPTE
jgi:rhodanese-related sulfurtransferase